MDNPNVGLYNKFRVERTDGSSAAGEKHYGCDYFVLDLTHDPFSTPAVAAYAAACEEEYPLLAGDLFSRLGETRETYQGQVRKGTLREVLEVIGDYQQQFEPYRGQTDAQAAYALAALENLRDRIEALEKEG